MQAGPVSPQLLHVYLHQSVSQLASIQYPRVQPARRATRPDPDAPGTALEPGAMPGLQLRDKAPASDGTRVRLGALGHDVPHRFVPAARAAPYWRLAITMLGLDVRTLTLELRSARRNLAAGSSSSSPTHQRVRVLSDSNKCHSGCDRSTGLSSQSEHPHVGVIPA
jgi:hypothetical protein